MSLISIIKFFPRDVASNGESIMYQKKVYFYYYIKKRQFININDLLFIIIIINNNKYINEIIRIWQVKKKVNELVWYANKLTPNSEVDIVDRSNVESTWTGLFHAVGECFQSHYSYILLCTTYTYTNTYTCVYSSSIAAGQAENGRVEEERGFCWSNEYVRLRDVV